MKTKRTSKCPQCGADVIQPRNSEDYCEECGWPDENRAEHPSGLSGEHGCVLDAIMRECLHQEP